MTSPDQRPSLTKTPVKQVFPEPTVGALIVNNEGKILLAKSHKWFDKYTLPGGHIEVGESMIDAVRREVKEEVGLDVEVVEMLLVQEAIFAQSSTRRDISSSSISIANPRINRSNLTRMKYRITSGSIQAPHTT